MLKRATIITVFIALFAAGGVLNKGVPAIWAQDPTIPTRTPTPNPNQPPPQPTDSGGGDDNTSPTNTPEPGQPSAPGSTPTQMPTLSSQPAQTPVGTPIEDVGSPRGEELESFLSNQYTIDSCDETPIIQALSRITVHAGPGINYPVLGSLEEAEIRPISGRGGFAPWWQVRFRPNLAGWVFDEEVAKFGNTALVPIVDPPLLNGVAPTPGPIWDPTPLPFVACTPTVTPVAPASGTADNTAAAAPGSSSPEQMTTQTAEVDGNAAETMSAAADDNALPAGAGVAARGLEASRAEGGRNLNLVIPLAGLGLIAAGIVLALLARTRSGNVSTEAGTDKN